MNSDTLKGNWKILKGKVQEKWGKLSNDQVDKTEGNFDQLVGEIQKAYGQSKEDAEKNLKQWIDSH